MEELRHWFSVETLVGAAFAGVHLGAIVSVLLARGRQPSATLSWVLAIALLPVVGVLLYLLIGRTRAKRRTKRVARVEARIDDLVKRHGVLAAHPAHGAHGAHEARDGARGGGGIDPAIDAMLNLGRGVGMVPASRDNCVSLLIDGRAAYASMAEAVEAARDHVHVEFYIVQPDDEGRRMRDALAKKAAQGVQVRVLCDAVGSLALADDFFEPVRQAGGETALYQPVLRALRLVRNWRVWNRVDFRNHRKIVVVDGRVGFTGGINVGREYLGRHPVLGPWRDSHVRIEGPAVLALQKTFAEDWLTATEKVLDAPRYFPVDFHPERGGAIVQIVASGPDRKFSPIGHFINQAIHQARERVWITTPYFIPAPQVETALVAAALRGVDVRLLFPGRSDNRIIRLASTTYYPDLISAGARIFHYQDGFIHAKTMVVDDWLGSVGSANMDMRSFLLNFELDAFVYDREFVADLARSFEKDLARSRDLGRSPPKVSLPRRIAAALARLLSPLL